MYNAVICVMLFMSIAGCSCMLNTAGPVGSSPLSPSYVDAGAVHDLPPLRRVDRRQGKPMRAFATYAQCQFEFSYETDPSTGLAMIPDRYREKVNTCLSVAVREGADVLILPELSLAFKESTRHSIIEAMQKAANKQDMIVVAGSFYDSNRQSRLPVIGPGWMDLGYKMKPSRFEASPRFGMGMKEGEELLLIQTTAGRIVPLTCVDLISDSAQYTVRNLATRGEIDVIANLNFNPAAWEFLIEANSIARRHPVVVSITNVAGLPEGRRRPECKQNADTGYCFGNSAVFASLREKDSDCPNCAKHILELVPSFFKSGETRTLPYDTMAAAIPASQEGMLIYDINLRMLREPASTNAPDQGYPVVRNLRRIPLNSETGIQDCPPHG